MIVNGMSPKLEDSRNEQAAFRPLIGLPMARDRSPRFYGLAIFIQNQTYVRALAEAGAAPMSIPLNLDETVLRAIYERLDGLFLPGGEDMSPESYGENPHELLGPTDPERDRTELTLARWALAEGKPIMAVCRGIQVLNVATGGTLFQDILTERPDSEKHDYFPPQFARNRISHEMRVENGTLLSRALDPNAVHSVNSMHHQAIKALGEGLRPSAVAPDGVVEALEYQDHPFAVGVQWHPEELTTSDAGMAKLFGQFVQIARK